MSTNTFKKHVDLLLLHEKGKSYYVLIKNFNTSVFDHTLHRGRKHFHCYCLQAFSAEEALKCHVKDCFKINGKQRVRIPQRGEYVDSNIMREIKSPFVFYANFESVLVPEDNGKQNKDESYINKY